MKEPIKSTDLSVSTNESGSTKTRLEEMLWDEATLEKALVEPFRDDYEPPLGPCRCEGRGPTTGDETPKNDRMARHWGLSGD